MQEPSADPDQAPQYHCPACGALVAPVSGQRLLVCPECGEQSFIPEDASSDENSQNYQEAEPTPDDSELSENRIRQMSNLKRGAYRNRSWCIVGAVACLVGAAELVQMTIHEARRGGVMLSIGFCFAAAAALIGSGYFLRAALQLSKEIRASSIPEPTTPPDFSTLSDGSQRWHGLGDASEVER